MGAEVGVGEDGGAAFSVLGEGGALEPGVGFGAIALTGVKAGKGRTAGAGRSVLAAAGANGPGVGLGAGVMSGAAAGALVAAATGAACSVLAAAGMTGRGVRVGAGPTIGAAAGTGEVFGATRSAGRGAGARLAGDGGARREIGTGAGSAGGAAGADAGSALGAFAANCVVRSPGFALLAGGVRRSRRSFTELSDAGAPWPPRASPFGGRSSLMAGRADRSIRRCRWVRRPRCRGNARSRALA